MERLEIENYCKSFLKEEYGIDLAVPVTINPRLTSTLGSFIHNTKTKTPIELEFSKKFMASGKVKDKIETIKHECIHYALFIQGKPFRDGDPYFKSELVKHGSGPTGVTEFLVERNVRVYKCNCREHVYRQTIRPSTCRKCNEKLVYVETRKQLI